MSNVIRIINTIKKVLKLKGKAAEWVKNIRVSLDGKVLKSIAIKNSEFTLTIPKTLLPEYSECKIILLTTRTNGKEYSLKCPSIFVYPEIKNIRLPQITVKNRKLIRNNKPFSFTGTNYTGFQLGLGQTSMGHKFIAKAIKTMTEWKITVIRIPLNIGLIQPAAKVFPDNPGWKEIYIKHMG